MLRSYTVLTIHGIAIRVHPTFGILLLWVIFHWGIQSGGGLTGLLFGFTLMMALFLFVVLHELGHSMMAIEYGVRVHDITLLPIGGVVRLDHLPDGGRREAMIALAGPAVNLAIAAALLPVVLAYGASQSFGSLRDYLDELSAVGFGGLLISLFFVNLTLVIFNLVPAFPMDGGRILRASASAFVGRERATRFAVIVGQLLALVIAAIGIYAGDLLLPLMALFVIVAAHGEGRAVRLESALRRLRVGQFALWDKGGIAPDKTLRQAHGGDPKDTAVTDGGLVLGMLWRRQILADLAAGKSDTRVADLMDTLVISVELNDSVYDVQQLMRETGRWAVPVVEEGFYRGIFTTDRFAHVYRYVNGQSSTAKLQHLLAARLAEFRASRTRASREWWRRIRA